jgi:hypothetical protein
VDKNKSVSGVARIAAWLTLLVWGLLSMGAAHPVGGA